MTTLIDVAIGVTLLYLSLALIVTTLQELIASVLASRAKRLYSVLADIVTGTVEVDGETKPLVQALYEHPLIRNLSDRAVSFKGGKPPILGRGLPSYLPSRTFVVALLDVLRGTRGAADAIGAGALLAEARGTIERVTDPELRRTLTLLVGDAEQLASTVDDRSRLVSERLETWFNDRMARAEGWYKRRAQAWSLGLAVVVAVAFNADTFHIVGRLWDDGVLRAATVALAEATDAPSLVALPLPLGWSGELPLPATLLAWTLRVLGWGVTAASVSLGAAFWFDVLSKALHLRGTGARVSSATGRVQPTPAGVTP